MFPSTITLTIATVAKVLDRRNQDNFGSTYQLIGTAETITMQIRHTIETNKLGKSYRRHNVLVEYVIYATPTTPEQYWSFSTVFRAEDKTDPAKLADLAKAVNVWLASGTVIADLSAGVN
jgi:hypothetical protein